MADLTDIVDLLREEANKDDTLDALLPTKVRDAVRWLERNYDFPYMDQVQTVVGNTWTTYPAVLTLTLPIKKLTTVRIPTVATDGTVTFNNLEKVEPSSFDSQGPGTPCHYSLTLRTKLWLDRLPTTAYNLELVGMFYTDLTEDDASCWLFDNAPTLVVAQAMLDLAPSMRSPEIIQLYTDQRESHLRTLLIGEDEFRWMGESPVMRPGGPPS